MRSAIVGFGGAIALGIFSPGHAAERIFVSYNILERSISVKSLEDYAKTGEVDEDLAVYAQYAEPNVLQNLRSALVAKANLSSVTVAQFLYSPQGDAALKRLGQVIQPESRLSGAKAIRAALILAAADPEGLTLLNFLQKFPTRGIRIDVERSLQVVGELNRLISQSQNTTDAITRQALAEGSSDPPIDVERSRDLRQPGAFKFEKQTITLNDPNRTAVISLPGVIREPIPAGSDPSARPESNLLKGRTYPVDLYLPTLGRATPSNSVPVVVISHGLGSDRSSFVYLAQHLASHGFAVLVPEHLGSSRRQIESLLAGIASEVAEPTEFVDRPLDITYLLTYLEQQARINPAYQALNLKQVGVMGQSFGGYTAFALAGAPINFKQLNLSCRDLENTFNPSLLLQCRAQQLEVRTPLQTDFRDPRIAAAIALNPITSAALGQDSISKITIPTLILTGSADTVAPALFEQVQPFTWLTTNDKYLVQLISGTHFSVIGEDEIASGIEAVAFPPEVIGPNPETARRYTRALSLAFFQTYIANQPAYRSYLTASYARSIMEAPIPIDLIRSLPVDGLNPN
ncbi:alpha/beta hydrolase [Leptolyngbya sp. Cla-17]|uniref:alpha/beta hydrolase n=1 Tax=Leptolyngbya sp. Cla-17 TaxID=2803751 RepID=UPI0018D6B1AD|nr:alpha/beta hydrolase [Leptolyngbya sp. Cla-17]